MKNFIKQQDNEPRHTAKTTKDFIMEIGGMFYTDQVNHLTLTQLSMHFPSWRAEEKEKLPKTNNDCKKLWKNLEKHHKRRMYVVMYVGQQFNAVNASKGYATKY